MEPLINAIMLWLSLNFALPLVADQPLVRHVSPDRLVAIHYGGMSGRPADPTVLGAYDAHYRTIYLRDDWDSRNATGTALVRASSAQWRVRHPHMRLNSAGWSSMGPTCTRRSALMR